MNTRGRKLFRIGAIGILVLFVAVRVLVYLGTRHLIATDAQVENSGKVLSAIGNLEASLNDAQGSVADYSSTGGERTLEPFRKAESETPVLLQQLRVLTANDPAQQKQMQGLDVHINAIFEFDEGLIQQRNNPARPAEAAGRQPGDMRAVGQTIDAMTQHEDQLLAMRSHEAASWVHDAAVIEMVLGVAGSALLLMAYLFIQWDLDEKAKVLASQRESEEKIRLLLNSTAEAMYGIDLDGRCTFCNPASLEILGYNSPEDLIGKNMHSLTHHTRPDGSPYPVAECRGYQAMRDGKGAHVDDEVLWRADGTSFPAEYWSYPIRHEDRIIGAVITFLDISRRRESEEKLQQVHDELNAALQASEARAFENRQLSNLGDLFQSCQTVEEACRIGADILPSILGSRSGAIYITNASRNVVEIAASWNGTSGSEQGFAPDDCWALRRGKLHSVSDLPSAPRCAHVTRPGGYVCVPLAAQGETLGVLYVEDRFVSGAGEPISSLFRTLENRVWEPHGEELERRALAVAERFSLALANLKLREMLRNQSIRDPLTGLFNRRYLEESLDRELHRASRKQRNVALIMIDLDHFKRFNDTFGHPAGDALLREFAAILKRRVRGGDVACRFGGEEFALIIGETSAAGACICVEQIRQDIKQLNVHYMGQPLGTVTLSAGVAVFPGDGQTAEDLVRAGDTALYRAKSEGRDRVLIYDHTPAPVAR
jgi:diguanylate cyclase (GGDEF)-like protein/PAS domain S-box-containing protein